MRKQSYLYANSVIRWTDAGCCVIIVASGSNEGENISVVTIAKIAELTGVSAATVSRVLRNEKNVAAATRELVLQTAAQLGRGTPEPTRQKRVLAVGSTPSLQIFPLLTAAAERYRISLLCKLMLDDNFRANAPEFEGEWDGVILIDGFAPLEELAKLRQRLTVVQCRTYSGLPSDVAVLVDNVRMGYDLARHLLAGGCRRIAYAEELPAFLARPFPRERRLGVLAALAEAGLSLWRVYPYDPATREELLLRALADGADAVILGGTYPSTERMLERARAEGLHIPEELAVAAFDDNEFCAAWGLTAIRQPLESIADASMLLLDDLIERRAAFKEATLVRVAHRLIPRGSTRPAE